MNRASGRVQQLVEAGQITPAEGERLRRALGGGSALWTIVLNPVEYLRPRVAAAAAAMVVLASLAVSQLGVRFDGALDLHRSGGPPTFGTAAVDQTVAVLCTALVFWLAGLIAARQGRLQDFTVAIAVARAPVVLAAVLAAALLPPPAEMLRYVQGGQLPLQMLIGSLATLPCMIWFFTWLYRGVAHSAGLTGARAAVTFAAAVLVAEFISKLVLRLMG